MEGAEYIKKIINEKYPDIDTREGGPFYQFLITPVDYLSAYFLVFLPGFVENYSIVNYDTIPDEFMDLICSNFFVDRSTGSKARGYVRVYFDSPRDLKLDANEVSFEDKEGLTFSLFEDYSISSSAMSQNITDDGFYYYIDLFVVADSPGSDYNALKHTIVEIASGVDDWVKIDNLDDFESGANIDTNESYYKKTADSISPREILLNQNSLEYKLLDSFPEIKEVLGIGFEDPEMMRDRIWDISIPANKNYYILQYMDNKRFINNWLKYNNLITIKETNGIYGIDKNFGSDIEISDAEYCQTRASDGDALKLIVGRFIDEQFDEGNHEFYNDWMTVLSEYEYTGAEPPEAGQAKEYIKIDEFLNKLEFTESQEEATLAIYKTPLPVNTNIVIEGRFSTGAIDAGERSTTSYVLLTDNPYEVNGNNVCEFFRGFGLAWRTATGSENNVFIVDNNAIEHEIAVGPVVTDHAQQVIDEGTGEVMQKPYLAATHVDIVPQTDYIFKIYVYADYKIEVKVWASDEFEPLDPNLSFGGGSTLLDFSKNVYLQLSLDYGPNTEFRTLNNTEYKYYYNYIRVRNFYSEGILLKSRFSLPIEIDSTYKEGKFIIYFNGTGNPSSVIKQFQLEYNGNIIDLAPYLSWNGSTATIVIPDIWKYDEVFTADKSLFNFYIYCKPAGKTDPLYIDCIEFETMAEGIHAGGYVDAFCHTLKPIEIVLLGVVSDATGKIEINITNGFTVPFLDIISIVDPSGPTTLEEGTDYDIYNGTDTLRFSHREDSYITITNPSYKQIPLDITYRAFQNYSDYQILADDILTKELCSDVLIKEFYPAIMELHVSISGTYDTDIVKDAICDYINSLNVTQITSSGIEDIIKANGPSIANVSDMSCNIKLPDRTIDNNWDNISGILSISIADTAHFYTNRQCRFLIFSEDIHFD